MPVLMNRSTQPPPSLPSPHPASTKLQICESSHLHLFACLAMSLQNSLWWWQQRHRKVGACALQVTLMGCNCYLGHNSKDVGAPPAQFSFTPMFQLLLQCPTYMQCLILSTKCGSEHFPILVMFSYCSFDVTMLWNQMVTWVNRVVR